MKFWDPRSGLCLVAVLAVLAFGLAACGGGGDGETASSDTSVTTSVAPPSTADTSSTAGTRARRARLPGPPGPAGPPDLSEAIARWHPLVEAGVPGGHCRPLLESVEGPLGRDAADDRGGRPYVSLYKGIAEGCLGRLQAARGSLAQARQVGLGDPDDPSTDTTCNAQLLLVFGFDRYLNEEISPVCPPPTTTTPAPTTTTRAPTTTTRPATTTTRAPTTTR